MYYSSNYQKLKKYKELLSLGIKRIKSLKKGGMVFCRDGCIIRIKYISNFCTAVCSFMTLINKGGISMRKKRVLSLLVSIMVAISLFAGCSTKAGNGSPNAADNQNVASNQSKATNKSIELNYLHIWPEYQQLMEKTIKMFEEKNPNIKVNITIVPWDKLTSTLQTSIAAANAPDVPVVWPNNMGNYEAIGAALDLTPYLDKDKEWKDSLVPSGLELGMVGKKYLAIPFRGTTTMLAYNKDLLEKNGWAEPKTMEEFKALADKMVAKNIVPLATPGNPGGFQVASLIKSFIEYELLKTGDIKDPEYVLAHKYDFKDQYAKAAKELREWYKKGYIGANALAVKREEAQALFYTGKAGFIFINNNEFSDIRKKTKEAGFICGFSAFPAPQGQTTLLYNMGVDGFFVYSKTKYPDQSIALLKSLTSNDVQAMWAKETLSVMALKSVKYEDPDHKKIADIILNSESYRQRPDYSIGTLRGDEDKLISEFLVTDSITPEKFAQSFSDLRKKVFEDNYKKK